MMSYDNYISTEPDYIYNDEEEMNRFDDLLDDEDREMETLEAEGEAIQAQHEQEELRYKDEVVQRLLETIDEYLTFSTARELIKLIGNNL